MLDSIMCVALLCSSCSGTRHAPRSDDVVDTSPDAEIDPRLETLTADRWCSDFGDVGLDQMVGRAMSDNLELKAAWARLKRADAVADIASARLWPTLSANGTAEYARHGSADFSEFDEGDGSNTEPYWEVSAAASYEVDIWGRHRHRSTAASLEADAAEANARALAITLTSRVAEAWFDVIAQRDRVTLLEDQLEVSNDILELTRLRSRRGIASALDVAQQEQNLESIRGQLAEAESLLSVSRHRLSVLVGERPRRGAAVTQGILPIESSGVPADLLEQRPDLRAAHLMLEAADERTAAAVADRLPQLRLTGDLGFQAEEISKLFEQLFWTIGAAVTQPVFEGGRLHAEVERNEAIAEERLYVWANTLLVAMREVRDALAREKNQHERLESLERERTIASSALELARKRYRNGASDYLRVLTALETLQEIERTLLEARRQQLSHRIGLCRALGGTWVDSVEPSIVVED